MKRCFALPVEAQDGYPGKQVWEDGEDDDGVRADLADAEPCFGSETKRGRMSDLTV